MGDHFLVVTLAFFGHPVLLPHLQSQSHLGYPIRVRIVAGERRSVYAGLIGMTASTLAAGRIGRTCYGSKESVNGNRPGRRSLVTRYYSVRRSFCLVVATLKKVSLETALRKAETT
jgi:hypothetical protein